MARRRGGGGGGGGGAPEWLVTFSDLMSLLCCFFVLIISFSTQDQQKVAVVSGSLRDAFGIRPIERRAGMVEVDGVPIRRYLKESAVEPSENDASHSNERHENKRKQGPEANTHNIEKAETEKPRQFASAAASLRQAWQDMPDIAEISKQIMIEETDDGLHIELLDQDGRSMFAEGSTMPYPATEALLARMAPTLRRLPHRLRISGHSTTGRTSFGNTGIWELSTGRALAVRKVLAANGVPNDQFDSIVGKADTEPLFPNDPYLAANRRISILLMSEAPPLPATHQP
ncbi:MAG: flagellar motor protein MotB [Hyphomicrobiaceae bacterium]|nr:flagellar motor protein MotB [Hyphomicrobiaceae bacterium]